VVSKFPLVLISALDKAQNAGKEPNWPGCPSLRIFFWSIDKLRGVVLQFLAAVWTRVRIIKVAELEAAMGAFEFVHFSLFFPGDEPIFVPVAIHPGTASACSIQSTNTLFAFPDSF
jgi:hypothetical protein